MAGSKGKCVLHVVTSYKFEHLTHLLVVEDGASFLTTQGNAGQSVCGQTPKPTTL